MKKTRFTEEQMVAILREQDGESTVEDICRKHGISNQTFYHWKKKFGSMEATDVKKMRQLEEENARLKRIVANLSLENEAINEVLRKKF
jgi:putative transposase